MSKIEEIVEHFVIYCFFGFAQASMVATKRVLTITWDK